MFRRRSTWRRLRRQRPHVPLSAGFHFDDDAPTAPIPVIPGVPHESYYMPRQKQDLPPSYPTDPSSPTPYAGPDSMGEFVARPAAEKLTKAWPARAKPAGDPSHRWGRVLPGHSTQREIGSNKFPRAQWPTDHPRDD